MHPYFWKFSSQFVNNVLELAYTNRQRDMGKSITSLAEVKCWNCLFRSWTISTKQETQLSLTNLCNAFIGQSMSPNIVPFHMLDIVSYCAIFVTLSLRRAVFTIFHFKDVVTLKSGSEVTQSHWKWFHSIDSKLLQVDHCKYPGLYPDKNMEWSAHIDYVYNVGIFYKLQYKVPSKCLRNIYYMHLFIHTY